LLLSETMNNNLNRRSAGTFDKWIGLPIPVQAYQTFLSFVLPTNSHRLLRGHTPESYSKTEMVHETAYQIQKNIIKPCCKAKTDRRILQNKVF